MSQNFNPFFDLSSAFGATGTAAFEGTVKGWEALVAQTSSYTSRAVNDAVSAMQQTATADSLEEASAIQAEYLKAAWKNAVAGATTFNSVAADMTRDVVGPIERAARARF